MEELLNYNWNVYKLFKSGKRAKAPFMTFEHCESDAEEFFEEEVKKNFNFAFAHKENKVYLLYTSDAADE